MQVQIQIFAISARDCRIQRKPANNWGRQTSRNQSLVELATAWAALSGSSWPMRDLTQEISIPASVHPAHQAGQQVC